MDCVIASLNDLCVIQDRNKGSRMDKRKQVDQPEKEDEKYKSKNLNAERRRRKKLSDIQLELRSLVPIITNMNKASIITDAITYIEELKRTVEELSKQLMQMEATNSDEHKMESKEVYEEEEEEEEMTKWGITQPQVQVSHFSGAKIWIKIVFQKKRGGLTKVMEAICVLGINLTDTSITTSRGAILFTSFGEGIHGGLPDADQINQYLLEIVRSI